MKSKDKRFIYFVMIPVGLAIAVTGILLKQKFLMILPLFVSLYINYLQSKANRYASLLGSINSLLYAFVYGYYHLYASMVYAIVASCPLQMITFIRWSKDKWKSSTKFREMTWKQRGVLTAIVLAVWGVMLVILNAVGSGHTLLDNTITMFGVLISFLTMFAYIEYSLLMLPSCLVSILLYVVMLRESPEMLPYLIYSLYCFACQCIAFVNVRRAYREQQAEKA